MMSLCYRPRPSYDEMSLFCGICDSSLMGDNFNLLCPQHMAWWFKTRIKENDFSSMLVVLFCFVSPWEQVPSHKYFPEMEVAMGSGWVVWISD